MQWYIIQIAHQRYKIKFEMLFNSNIYTKKQELLDNYKIKKYSFIQKQNCVKTVFFLNV